MQAKNKRLRNEITSDLGKAKAAYFRDQLKKAKTTAAYWNVLSKATKSKVRKKIGPLKRDDNGLAVKDTEKASLMNCFFSTIAEKLNAGQPQAPQPLTSPGHALNSYHVYLILIYPALILTGK